MEDIDLWQREGMSSSYGVSCSRRTSEALSGSVLVSVEGGGVGLSRR